MTVKFPCKLSSPSPAQTHILLIDDHTQGEKRTSVPQYFFSSFLYNLRLTCYIYTLESFNQPSADSDFLTPNPLLQGLHVVVWVCVSRCKCIDGRVGVSKE